jgi:hypothetical protein
MNMDFFCKSFCLFVLLCVAAAAFGGERRIRTALYDSGSSSNEPLSGEAAAKQEGWARISPPEKPDAFKGDAILLNETLLVVLRKNSAGLDLYSREGEAVVLRGLFYPLFENNIKGRLAAIKVIANEVALASVEAVWKTEDGKEGVVVCSLSSGAPLVKAEPRGAIKRMAVAAPARLGILPDFFGDDMVVDAAAIPVQRAEVPSENFFLIMNDEGDAITTLVWNKNEQDVELVFAGEGDEKKIVGVEIACVADSAVWSGVLTGKGIWQKAILNEENGEKEGAFPEKVPFKAKWKTNFMRADHTVDSWECEYSAKSNRHWSGVAGGYMHPCWIVTDKENVMTARYLAPKAYYSKICTGVKYAGPTTLYPVDRLPDTPNDKFTVVDLMRNSLGAGPCEYIMDVEGQKVGGKGLYTCQMYDYLSPLANFGRMKDERLFVERMMRSAIIFVTAIQDRINHYVKFAKDLQAYAAEQKKARPEAAEFLTKIEELTKMRDIAAKEADGGPQFEKLLEQFKPDITADVPKLSPESVFLKIRDGFGLPQDNRVARCRLAVKLIRQRASLETALNPKNADIAQEVRKRTHAALRGGLGHEMR